MKEKVIKLLEKEKWYPLKPTNIEWETSKLLNKILDNIINEVKGL